jgi:hypothetical protein
MSARMGETERKPMKEVPAYNRKFEIQFAQMTEADHMKMKSRLIKMAFRRPRPTADTLEGYALSMYEKLPANWKVKKVVERENVTPPPKRKGKFKK